MFRDYLFAGLKVRSEVEIALAKLLPSGTSFVPDVEIRLCAPEKIPAENGLVDSKPQDFSFRASDNLAFRIRGGREIIIGCTPETPHSDINLYLIGSAWGVLCHQRNLLPLHCSAVMAGHGCVAFCGPSGIGKSTLAAGLAKYGYTHICDDVATLELVQHGIRFQPVEKGLKLWRDAADALNIVRGPRVGSHPDLDKYYVSLPTNAAAADFSVHTMYLLKCSKDGTMAINPVNGMARFEVFLHNIYRYEWAVLIRDPAELFLQVSALLEHIEIFEFTRPRDLAKFGDGLKMLSAHIKTREEHHAKI